MTVLRSQVQIGDIIDNSSIVTYVGKFGFTALEFATSLNRSNHFNSAPKHLNVTRTDLTTIEQITAHYPELFI